LKDCFGVFLSFCFISTVVLFSFDERRATELEEKTNLPAPIIDSFFFFLEIERGGVAEHASVWVTISNQLDFRYLTHPLSFLSISFSLFFSTTDSLPSYLLFSLSFTQNKM
jgi:hypothetical protein